MTPNSALIQLGMLNSESDVDFSDFVPRETNRDAAITGSKRVKNDVEKMISNLARTSFTSSSSRRYRRTCCAISSGAPQRDGCCGTENIANPRLVNAVLTWSMTFSSSTMCSSTSNAPIKSKAFSNGMSLASICNSSTFAGSWLRPKSRAATWNSEPATRSQRRTAVIARSTGPSPQPISK